MAMRPQMVKLWWQWGDRGTDRRKGGLTVTPKGFSHYCSHARRSQRLAVVAACWHWWDSPGPATMLEGAEFEI